jgi:hypothetical protein
MIRLAAASLVTGETRREPRLPEIGPGRSLLDRKVDRGSGLSLGGVWDRPLGRLRRFNDGVSVETGSQSARWLIFMKDSHAMARIYTQTHSSGAGANLRRKHEF